MKTLAFIFCFVLLCCTADPNEIARNNGLLSTQEGPLEDLEAVSNLIVPGTKWCGSGNISQSEADLGAKSKLDSCCREHDMCPLSIPAGESKNGLKNSGRFAKSSCECDEKLSKCLKNVNSLSAKKVGIIYFNLLKPKCIATVNCSDSGAKCAHGQKSGIQYQWADNVKF